MLFLPPVPDFSYAAAHASEIQYLFALPNSTLSTDQQALSATMVKYWSNFAKAGDPNGAGLPTWSKYDTTGDVIVSLGTGASGVAMTTAFKTDHRCQ